MKPFDLTGRVAVVTGGNGGIGLGMARGLAAAGCRVVVAGRNVAKSEAAVAELQAAGASAVAVPVDVADERSINELVALVMGQSGRIDILVNNAGINIRKPPDLATLPEWNAVLATNLTGPFLLSRQIYPFMKKQGGGKIIHVGSMMSLFGAAFLPAYAASKGGLVQLTRSQATAWAGDNIQVNAILPGWIDTDLTVASRREVPGLEARVIARTPAGRFGRPDELAGIVVFLASAASDFVTGTAIPVDGGYSIQG